MKTIKIRELSCINISDNWYTCIKTKSIIDTSNI